MRGLFRISLLTLATLTGCLPNQWPSEVKRCYVNETASEFNKCLLESARNTIPLLRKGMKAWGVPSLEPFQMISDLIVETNRPAIKLSFRISNGTCYGPTYFDLKKASYDHKKKEYFFEGVHSNTTTIGNYEVKGKLFGFNLNSNGEFRLETINVKEELGARMYPTKKSGYVFPKFKYKVKGMDYLKFWMSDRKLPPFIEQGVIDVVNDNWKLLLEAMGSDMEEGFSAQYHTILGPLFKRFPYHEVILGSEVIPGKEAGLEREDKFNEDEVSDWADE